MSLPPDLACNCSALRQASRRVTRLYDEALAPLGLGANQYSILVRLDRPRPACVADLAAALVADATTVSRLLKPLAARGLVAVEPCGEDGRKRRARLTPDGRALLAEGRPLWAAAQERFEAAFGAGEAARLRGDLARVSTLPLPPAP